MMGDQQSKSHKQPPSVSQLQTHSSPREYTDVHVTVPPGSSPTLDGRVAVKCVVALYNYEGRTADDVSFVKGDIIEIFEHGLDSDWWLGRVKSSGLEGYIPRSYVSDDLDMEKAQGSVSNTRPDLQTACIPQKYTSSRHPVKTDCTGSVDTVIDGTVRKVKKALMPLPTQLPTPPPSPDRVIKLVVALDDYEATTEDDLSFKKGDILEILQTRTDKDWFWGRVKNASFVGYIPSNFVKDVQDDAELPECSWWWPVVRYQAERMLLSNGLPEGTFLIRFNSNGRNKKSLSVRFNKLSSGPAAVKHYQIEPTDSGGWIIGSERPFPSLGELVSFYKENSGLCCRLTLPCPKTKPVTPFEEMEIDRERIQLFQELGRGYFGEVYLGKINSTQDVAIKSMKPDKMNKEAFLEEAKAMHALRHSKLVQLMGVCTVGDPMYIITEFMSEGNLLKYVRKDCGKTLKFDHLMDMSSQIAYGMSYLESHKYIHRDLRAENILVGPNNEVKVADFGLARLVTKDTNDIYKMSNGNGAKFPRKWTAPEAGLFQNFSIKSDVWSFGVLLYEIFTYGRHPYPDMGPVEVLEQTEVGYRMEKPVGQFECPNKLYELMLNCWDQYPDQRPTFDYMRSYLEDFDMSFEM